LDKFLNSKKIKLNDYLIDGEYKVQMSLKKTESLNKDVQDHFPFLSKHDHLLAEIVPRV
jgi:hypothetical protein